MLPHNHFLIASIIIAPVGFAFFPEKSSIEVGEWALVGGLLSLAIDLDIVVLAILKSKKEKRLAPFRNLVEVYRNFRLFMDTIAETGILKTGLKTHTLSSALIILIFYLFLSDYLVPVFLGVASHLMTDAPHLRKLVN
ncbi:MAG: hypothetical protein ACUVV6_01580 [Thermoplasmatota archaeon]